MLPTPAPVGPRRTRPCTRMLTALLMAVLAGCTLIERTFQLPMQGAEALLLGDQRKPVDAVELQEDLLRYADNLSSAAVNASLKLQKDDKPIPRDNLLTIWIAVVSDVLATATGANALGNLVDMVVLTTAGRMRIQEYWIPKVYGESGKPMLEAFISREKQIWELAEKVMTTTQRSELRKAIEEWRLQSLRSNTALTAFASISLVSEITRGSRKRSGPKASSVFSLLDLDPLAGLDPATRELAQTRLLAERAMFIGQRMPQLLQWQAELLALRTGQVPEVQQLVANSTRYAELGERIGKLAEEIPGLADTQREEIFKGVGREREQVFRSIGLERNEIFKGVGQERTQIFRDFATEREKLFAALHGQQPGLVQLSKEVGTAMGEGAHMATATDGALRSFSSVLGELNKPKDRPDPPNAEPFRIRDYGEAAAEIGRATAQLNTLLTSLQPLLSPESLARIGTEAGRIGADAESRGRDLVDYAFRRLLQLLVAAAGLTVAGALAFRYLSLRIVPGTGRAG